MLRSILTTTAIAVMAGSAVGADYMFPTAYPSGVDLDTVKQIVTFIWDDNAYSGLSKTDYELSPDDMEDNSNFVNHQWVGGKKPWGASADNGLNIQEGDMGMAWAISKLAGIELPPATWKPGLYLTDETTLKDGKIWKATKRVEHTAKEFVGVDPDTVSIQKSITTSWNPVTVVDTTLYWDDLEEHERNAMVQSADWVKVEDFVPTPHAEGNGRVNPDGSPIKFTFNVISGLFVPIIGAQDGNRVSKYGYWNPNDKDLIEFPHLDAYKSGKLPIAWGREMPIYATAADTDNVNGEAYGRINDVFITTNDLGHEIGNHTVDHLESNSMLPQQAGPFPEGTNGEWTHPGFSAWGGDGFAADEISPMKWGDIDTEADEAAEFGKERGITWHRMGWEMYAGRTLSKEAWSGLIELGEEDLEIALGVTPLRSGGAVAAFRAPRLEVNGAMHYALAELGYLYDCGQEEGYGTDFIWPYTTDNGSPNVTYQHGIGENVSIDSMPAGFWQVPVNAMVVPEEIRESVWSNYATVSEAEGHPHSEEDKQYWINHNGRVTGFDFNMFILWGMTKDNALTTLKHNLDLRLKGGKAPMQVGSHTDYFTPIYDNATLLEEFNRPTYGLCVDKGWNNWLDRKATFEEFIDYGLTKGAYFWSGAQTVEYAQKIANSDKIGTEAAFNQEWTFFNNPAVGSTSDQETGTGSIKAAVSIKKTIEGAGEEPTEYPNPGYRALFAAGDLDGLDHISLDYNTSAPVALKLIMDDGESPHVEVWLSNLNNDVKSGKIPLTAFQYDVNGDLRGVRPTIDPSKITAIELKILLPGTKDESHTLSVSNVKIYSGKAPTAIANGTTAVKQSIALKSFRKTGLQLDVPTAGVYNVDIFTVDGRIVKQFKNSELKSGANNLSLNGLSTGLYMLRIHNGSMQKVLKAALY